MRAWARENGYEVAGRGRLPGEVTDAYLAATKPAKRAATKPTAKKATPSKTAPAKGAPAKTGPAKPARAKVVAPVEAETPSAPAPVAAPEPEAAAARTPQPKPSVVGDDRRLVALGEEIAALTKRVEALEQGAGSKSGGSSKGTRFRRRS